MLKHENVWAAIDALAARSSLTASALAKKAGLDPTTFNKSKRLGNDGRPRWPSTESIAKVIDATGATLDEFMRLLSKRGEAAPEIKALKGARAPLRGFAQAGAGGYFEDAGFPLGEGWEHVEFPGAQAQDAYALRVSGDSMLPLYRDGDTVIIAPHAPVRRGDRVVVRSKSGEVMVKILKQKTGTSLELASLNADYPNPILANSDIDWVARIIWASQ